MDRKQCLALFWLVKGLKFSGCYVPKLVFIFAVKHTGGNEVVCDVEFFCSDLRR
ncbi:unnamed protein product [Trifolium pratense]|uniref:Uncharacterized protein n=1 Tax=Trifolium pratense TaxID=57577 RepID=A0ACB0IIV5_TRIPR|nr:unnamed protein product [Trifolium pratense]